MASKGPKCKICSKTVSLMSYDTGYMKVVKPGQPKAGFVCWDCAGKLLGGKLEQITAPE
jgi:hypothetical protein